LLGSTSGLRAEADNAPLIADEEHKQKINNSASARTAVVPRSGAVPNDGSRRYRSRPALAFLKRTIFVRVQGVRAHEASPVYARNHFFSTAPFDADTPDERVDLHRHRLNVAVSCSVR
jgi:hypothetical protein